MGSGSIEYADQPGSGTNGDFRAAEPRRVSRGNERMCSSDRRSRVDERAAMTEERGKPFEDRPVSWSDGFGYFCHERYRSSAELPKAGPKGARHGRRA